MKDEQPKSWWETIPGCLTGLAAVITATTGLVVALTTTDIGTTISRWIKPPQPSPTSPASPPSCLPPGEVKAVINDPDGYTNVRSGRGTQYEIIARINRDEVFSTIPKNNSDWWQVRTSKGNCGYMHRSRIRIQN